MTGAERAASLAAGLDADLRSRGDAAFELARNIVVEAGAGTGKTTLLTDRIFHALLAGGPRGKGVAVDRLVAVTFTNKAAGEIKERVSGLLLDILSPGRIKDAEQRARVLARVEAARQRFGLSEDHVRSVAAAAVEDMDRAAIGTIHHLAATILRLYPVEAGLDPEFKVDMGESFDELFEEEWLAWLSVELGEDAPRKEAWLDVLRLAALSELKELAAALAAELPAECVHGPAPRVKARLERFLAEFKALERIAADPGRSGIRDSITEAGRRLSGAVEGWGRVVDLPERLEPWRKTPLKWPAGWKSVPGEELYKRGLKVAAGISPEGESLIVKAAALVEPFSLRLKELHARRGFVSNDGLLCKSLALVRDCGAARQELKARFDAILIDEFQDTDPQQGELLLFLAEAAGTQARDWREVRLAPGKLFIVGDPKQSIYRFRGADMRAYDGFRRLVLDQGALRCALQRNFRSAEGIIGPVNEVFRRLMRQEDGLQPEYIPILPAKATGSAAGAAVSVAAVRDPKASHAPLAVEDCRAAEARWIADWIRSNRGASLAYKDIAVLFRVTTSINVYLQALKDAGIPYAVESERYFYGSQEIIDFTNLLAVLDDPGDGPALAGLLRSPLAGLTDSELCALSGAGPLSLFGDPRKAEGLRPGTAATLSRLFRTLLGLRRYASREPLDAFVSRVFEETFLLELCSAAYHHEQTASNLLKFKRLAKEANDARGATLKEFVAEVSAAAADPDAQEGESPLADEHYDAVRLMSIHKAKGLEFRSVILPDLRRGLPGRGDGVAEVDWSAGSVGLRVAGATDAAMALIADEEARRSEHEALRLLYVAMTRAKERLILVGGGALRKGEAGSFARTLRSAGAWIPEGANPPCLVLEGDWTIPVEYVDAGSASRPERPAAEAAPKTEARHATLAAAWRERFEAAEAAQAKALFAAPTDYLHEPEKGGLESEDALERGPGGRRSRPAVKEDAALLGELCHRVLESWDFKAESRLDRAVDRAERVLRSRHPLADWKAIGDQARSVLEGFLASAAARELAGAEILDREAHFIMPAGSQVVRGSIDILYRQGGRLWVGDYKLDGRGRERKARLYRRQGQAYVDAVQRALGERAGFKLFFLREGESLAVIDGHA
ncbi:MAG: UvrD-helicase domain-containing protein [Elusimicrobia bacterium]|nr:UvrD-helicase domain-containing protein [Elusimicrobiota bacterium]